MQEDKVERRTNQVRLDQEEDLKEDIIPLEFRSEF